MLKDLFQALQEVTAQQNDFVEELFLDKLVDLKLADKYDNNEEFQNDKLNEKFLDIKPENAMNWNFLDTVQELPNFENLNIATNNNVLKMPDYQQKTQLKYNRKGIDGTIVSFKEQVKFDELLLSDNDKVFSLKRKIDPNVNKITGSSENKPFLPGLNNSKKYSSSTNTESEDLSAKLHKDDLGLYDIPPSMKRGINPQFVNDSLEEDKSDENLASLLQLESTTDSKEDLENIRKDLLNRIDENNDNEVSESLGKLRGLLETKKDKDKKAIDALLPETISFGRVNKKLVNTNTNDVQIHWAHEVNINHHIPNFDELVPHPARSWPFELDTFQKEAILHLEQGDSVFVAAHTSAGKTVVAEYAIAMSKRNMTKTIYTSPIKALSNQKFRDFKTAFDDIEIGLITGDVQINKDADCLIMTTEILRSMLYKGADLLRDIEFVIFDEVHYINDQERGVVWEEVIIMLPPYVKFVLLSATVPNTFEFANWIGRTKQKNIYVISTPKRPVPLEINIWAKDTILPVINANREFIDYNFKKHIQLLQPKSIENKNDKKKTGEVKKKVISTRFQNFNGPSKNTWPSLLGELKKKNLLPAVIFVFSQKRCSEYADQLGSSNFINAKESSHVRMLIDRSINRLKKEDRELPQILAISNLLQKGIAVHHGGLLPIVKELVEILFAEGYIKVLFATETFAMGLNLPTRTVVFSEIRKHDGNQQRYLNPGEFTQMAGRAGRRGLDDCGTVIIMAYKDPLSSLSFKEVTLGKPTKLESQFRLTYNMIVNLLRIESLKMEDMIQFSFGEDKGQQQKLEIKAKEVGYEEILESDILKNLKVNCDSCTDETLDQFLNLLKEYETVHENSLKLYSSSKSVLVSIETGRAIIYRSVVNNKIVYNIGIIFKNTNNKGSIVVMKITEDLFVDFGIDANNSKFYIPYISELNMFTQKFKLSDQFMMKDITIMDVEYLTKSKNRSLLFMALSNDENKQENVNQIAKNILKTIEPIKFKGMIDIELTHLINQEQKLKQKIITLEKKLSKCENYRLHIFEKWQIDEALRETKSIVDNELKLLPDYENRLSVLKELGFVDETQNVELKGRVACEISVGFELIITEILFDNFMSDLSPEEIVALLSCFIFNGSDKVNSEQPLLTNNMLNGKTKIEETYETYLSLSSKYKIPMLIEEADFLMRNRFQLANVVYQWASGISFAEIMKISPQSEGTIVRVINRLNELCKQLKNASIIIGNSELHAKFSTAQELINRDIVFAASLYL
ncbi:antiviral helicase [Hanseniaspora valbyensis NRRL Y-1626]|uniref:Antiviral helicase n=1 Tax=Hanseniaspora valbyensis NRRL Y-1626 TaxID=766949 RepID=A0A1B7T995_9ASCO|nr:antiviral helicase [Hanseniaspora valbyensis NRRL Y-1626]